MNQPELFDIVELLVTIPEENLEAGVQGTIVECFDEKAFEVEFSDSNGKTLALYTLPPQEFIVVWQAKTKSWLSTFDRIAAIVEKFDSEKQKAVFEFAKSLRS